MLASTLLADMRPALAARCLEVNRIEFEKAQIQQVEPFQVGAFVWAILDPCS
jgi:hypothetical protein